MHPVIRVRAILCPPCGRRQGRIWRSRLRRPWLWLQRGWHPSQWRLSLSLPLLPHPPCRSWLSPSDTPASLGFTSMQCKGRCVEEWQPTFAFGIEAASGRPAIGSPFRYLPGYPPAQMTTAKAHCSDKDRSTCAKSPSPTLLRASAKSPCNLGSSTWRHRPTRFTPAPKKEVIVVAPPLSPELQGRRGGYYGGRTRVGPWCTGGRSS